MSIRKQYDTDLESLKNSLTEMGRNSADAVENALEALCIADADAAAAIVKGGCPHQQYGAGYRAPLHDLAAASAAGGGRFAPHLHRHEGGHGH